MANICLFFFDETKVRSQRIIRKKRFLRFTIFSHFLCLLGVNFEELILIKNGLIGVKSVN